MKLRRHSPLLQSSSTLVFQPQLLGSIYRLVFMLALMVQLGVVDSGAASFAICEGSFDDVNAAPLAATSTNYPGIADAHVLKTLALRDCIRECARRHLTPLLITADAKVIMDKCLVGDVKNSKVGSILREIRSLLAGFSGNCELRFVGRHRNRVAHLVAKKSLSLSPRVLSRFDYVSWLRSL
ncbi:unnamed protein product [Linum trigynum]|uniref:RNase H type-1 domain-containing protein n=1 Tax=Linum trigynum TaxID=586398 RepID=A0AAV2E3H3_9ROSI